MIYDDPDALQRSPFFAQVARIENLVGARGFLGAGAVLVLLGSALAFKLGVEHQFLSPLMRVILGIIFGTTLIGASEPARRFGRAIYSDAITGLGAAVLYLSIFSAWTLFHLPQITEAGAFIAMTAVTALVASLAYARRSIALTACSLGGGLVTPLLVAGGVADPFALGLYLAVLCGVFSILANVRGYGSIRIAAIAGAMLYSPALIPSDPSLQLAALPISALFLALAIPLFVRVRSNGIDKISAASILALGAWYLTGLEIALRTQHDQLALVLLGACSLLTAAAYLTRTNTYAWSGLAFLTAAIPAYFHGSALAVGWAFEGAALVVHGTRSAQAHYRLAGAALIAIVVLDASSMIQAQGTPFLFNDRFMTLFAAASALAVAIAHLRKYAGALSEIDDTVATFAHPLIHVLFLCAFSFQAYDYFGTGAAVSIVWAAYACAIVLLGFLRRSAMLRWEGIVLFGFATLKVAAVDLATLELLPRVVSTIVTGVVLMGVSYLYQQRLSSSKAEEAA